uniref:Uncharacterized protein n=1 Tax=Triticum urartu TaxID=4572 RepID=A0A8R7TMT8_TRIUA
PVYRTPCILNLTLTMDLIRINMSNDSYNLNIFKKET